MPHVSEFDDAEGQSQLYEESTASLRITSVREVNDSSQLSQYPSLVSIPGNLYVLASLASLASYTPFAFA